MEPIYPDKQGNSGDQGHSIFLEQTLSFHQGLLSGQINFALQKNMLAQEP